MTLALATDSDHTRICTGARLNAQVVPETLKTQSRRVFTQSAEGGGFSARSDDRNDGEGSIISELVSLIEHVHASVKLIESAIAMEPALGDPGTSANVVVLDDVTPRYQNARAALNTCNTSLEVTLHLLRDTKTSPHGTNESAAYELRPAGLVGRA